MTSRAAVVLVCLLAVAACGGEEAAAPTATETQAPAASPFVASAEAVCESLTETAAGFNRRGKPSDATILALMDDWRADFDRLAALDPPADVRPHVERMLLNYRRLADAMVALVEAEDETALVAAAGIAVFGQRGSRAARAAGLDRCALAPPIEQPPPDPEQMYSAALALVPEGATITRDDPGCEEHGCVIEFELGGDLATRLAAARRALESHGWKSIRSGRKAPVTRWLMANRNDFLATIEVVGRPLPPHCGRSLTFGCVDSVWINRVEVPEVLTGG